MRTAMVDRLDALGLEWPPNRPGGCTLFRSENYMIIDDHGVTELLTIARDAGKAILDVYARDFEVDYKGDDSPLTQADRDAHRTISQGLHNLDRPNLTGLPVISEEGQIPGASERRTWESYWLIDPLDGTKEFVKKNGEFTVNIALMRRISADDEVSWEPMFGLVYAPVLDEAYVGWQDERGSQAYYVEHLSQCDFSSGQSPDSWWLSARPIMAQAVLPGEGEAIIAVASRSHSNEATEQFISRLSADGRKVQAQNYGSSLKLCKVASGEAHVYPRFAPTMEWDTAAADGVCRAAGAQVLNAASGRPLQYNKTDLLNPYFLVTGIIEIKDML